MAFTVALRAVSIKVPSNNKQRAAIRVITDNGQTHEGNFTRATWRNRKATIPPMNMGGKMAA
jgi:hypothetical protein